MIRANATRYPYYEIREYDREYEEEVGFVARKTTLKSAVDFAKKFSQDNNTGALVIKFSGPEDWEGVWSSEEEIENELTTEEKFANITNKLKAHYKNADVTIEFDKFVYKELHYDVIFNDLKSQYLSKFPLKAKWGDRCYHTMLSLSTDPEDANRWWGYTCNPETGWIDFDRVDADLAEAKKKCKKELASFTYRPRKKKGE